MNDDISRFFSRSAHCDLAMMRRIVTDIDTIMRTLQLSRQITTWGATEQPKVCLYGGLPLHFGPTEGKANSRRRVFSDTDSAQNILEGTCVLPIQIWLTHQYPIEPPTIYMVCSPFVNLSRQDPNRRMPLVRIMSNHPYVDITGLCFFSELADWKPATSTLCVLIEHFGRALEKCGVCPIYIDENLNAGAPPQTPDANRGQRSSLTDECIVCYAPRDTVLVPCGHYCLCDGCAANVLECPVCRTKIKVRQRTFQ